MLGPHALLAAKLGGATLAVGVLAAWMTPPTRIPPRGPSPLAALRDTGFHQDSASDQQWSWSDSRIVDYPGTSPTLQNERQMADSALASDLTAETTEDLSSLNDGGGRSHARSVGSDYEGLPPVDIALDTSASPEESAHLVDKSGNTEPATPSASIDSSDEYNPDLII